MNAGEIASERAELGVAVITFSGEHDLNTAPDLRHKLEAQIEDGFAVVVDLSGAAFVDSSILGAILDARRRARDAGIGFEVALNEGAEAVERVLDVTGLRTSLPVHSTRTEAIEAARSAASSR
jgi:anti-sigma B factor antagonist